MYAAACRSSFSSMKSHIWPTRDMIRLIHITDVLQWFLPGFGRAVCQSSFASSLTDCTGETIWIAITWQNVTYFKQRRVRNQDKKERGKTERSAAGVKSIPFLCCSLSPPITAPAVLLIETHWSPNVPVESQGARFIVRKSLLAVIAIQNSLQGTAYSRIKSN